MDFFVAKSGDYFMHVGKVGFSLAHVGKLGYVGKVGGGAAPYSPELLAQAVPLCHPHLFCGTGGNDAASLGTARFGPQPFSFKRRSVDNNSHGILAGITKRNQLVVQRLGFFLSVFARGTVIY